MYPSKKVLLLLLTLALTVCLFSGCETEADKVEKLSGNWSTVTENSRQQATALLESVDLYPEEIALAEDIPLTYVQAVEFTAQKSYRFYICSDDTLECVRSYFLDVFDALYEGRQTLNELYDQDFGPMKAEEFQQFYARLYVVNDFDALIRQFTACAYAPAVLDPPLETGTYTIRGNNILCTAAGEDEAGSLGYTLKDDQLTLSYSDGTEVYTRID